jgi:3-oxoacyl-[acyl-carrier protein] reductase
MIDPGLNGRVVVITGSNSPYGIGAGVAKAFARQGAKLLLHYYRQQQPPASVGAPTAMLATKSPGGPFYWQQQSKNADEVRDMISGLGAQVCTWEGDFSDPAAVPAMFDEAERTLGPVEVLVNNAAYWEADTFLPTTAELENRLVELWTDRPQAIRLSGFDKIFAVNTRATALAMAEFARRHIGRGAHWGRIVNVSTAGAECFPSEATYGASKLALESYTRTAAMELGRLGITVNVLALGPVQTGWITAELEEKILPTIPLRRIGTPEDVAGAIVFLASDQGGWITGQRIYVGGGHGL